MSIAIDPRRLSLLLQDEVAHTRQLLQVLTEEYEALRQPDAERITAISRQKLDCLQALEQRTGARVRFLKEHGLPATTAATEELVRACPEGSASRARWHELQELAAQAQRQNEINGGIVALAQRHTRMALDILSGKETDGETYGRSGTAATETRSHSLAKA